MWCGKQSEVESEHLFILLNTGLSLQIGDFTAMVCAARIWFTEACRQII
jgi:hypothetical protein